jgi:hypothetical protein
MRQSLLIIGSLNPGDPGGLGALRHEFNTEKIKRHQQDQSIVMNVKFSI